MLYIIMHTNIGLLLKPWYNQSSEDPDSKPNESTQSTWLEHTVDHSRFFDYSRLGRSYAKEILCQINFN